MALDDTIELLARARLFGLLERDALRLIAFSAETRRLRTDEFLFRKGDRSDGGYVVMEGQIGVTHGSAEEIVSAGPGSLIGQVALFVRTQRPSSAVARMSASVVRISPTLMRRVLQEFPEGAARVRAAMAEDLDELSNGLARVRRMLLAIDGF